MKTVLILVEGQTDETIVGDTLNPHLAPHGVLLRPVILLPWYRALGHDFFGWIHVPAG